MTCNSQIDIARELVTVATDDRRDGLAVNPATNSTVTGH